MTGAPEPAPGAGRRRRRRRRPSGPDKPAPAPSAQTTEPDPPAKDDQPATKPARKRRPARESGTERGLRDLVGAGRSQLGVDGALRGRDVNRPTEQDLADAERDVVIVRRNWKPTGPS
jgi:hypothetical protein